MIKWILSYTTIDFSAIQCLWTIPVRKMGSCKYVGTKMESWSIGNSHTGMDSTILCTAMPQYSYFIDSKVRFCDFSLVTMVSLESCVLYGVSWTVYHDNIQIRHVHWWANIP